MRILSSLLLAAGFLFITQKLSHTQKRVFFILYMACILFVTLGMRSYDDESVIVTDLFSPYQKIAGVFVRGYHKGGWREVLRRIINNNAPLESVILNVLLFIPFGYILPCASNFTNDFRKVVGIGSALSLFIETTQLITHLGWFDVSDIIHNGLGAMIGYWLYKRGLRGQSSKQKK